MINQQLLDFIKSQLQLGLNKEKITRDLLANGWTAQDIEEGFNTIAIPTPSIPTKPNTAIPPSDNKTNLKVEDTKLIIFVRTLIVFPLSLIFGYYTFGILLNHGGQNTGYLAFAGSLLIVFMLIPAIPFFFLFRYLLNRQYKHRSVIYFAFLIFLILNIWYIIFSLQNSNKQPSMFPAKLETNGSLQVGYALQYKITTIPKVYFNKKGNIYLNIELVQPDGTTKKEFAGIDMQNCTQYLLTPACTPQASYERTFVSDDSVGNPNLFEKPGTYTLTSDSPEITPVTFQVTN